MRKYYLSILFFILTFCSIPELQSQSGNGFNVRRADNYYDQFDFKTALAIYQTVAKKQEDNLYVKGRIGNCYKFLNQIQNAETWYEPVAMSDNTDPIFKFYYAQSLQANGKYEEAVQVFNTYYTLIGEDDKIISTYPTDLLVENPKFIVEIEDFNSKHADFSPFQIKEDLYFITNRKDDAYLSRDDVWSHRPFTQIYRIDNPSKDITDNQDSIPKEKASPEVFNKSAVSKRYHEGPVAWDASKNDLYLTRSNYSEKKPVKGDDNEVNLKIVKVAFFNETGVEGNGDFGGEMVNNTSFSKDEYSYAYPTITVDGNYMIFASDMPGGFGGLDLYLAENVSGMWSNPMNLGGDINTPGNDAFPFFMQDGTLFYASDGRVGLGGYDIYEAKLLEDGSFASPVNLRSPINSSYDDFGFWMDERYSNGYFTSNRPSQYGDDDIYSFIRQTFIFEAIVYDSKTLERLPDAEVKLINLNNGKSYPLITDADGYVSTEVLPNSDYSLQVSKEEYLPENAQFKTLEDNVYAEIPLMKDFGIVLDVTVIDQDTKEEIPFSNLTIINLDTEEETTVVTNKYGKSSFVVEPDTDYRIRASKDLDTDEFVYIAVSNDFNTNGVKAPAQLYTTIELKKQGVGVEILIEDILYDLDKYFIRPDAALILNNTVKLLMDNPNIEIELASHTDCRASQTYNMWLSAKRAEAAVNYIIGKGIDYRRLTAAGYGESLPLQVKDAAGNPTGLYCTCEGTTGPGKTDARCTEEVHQLNRRTTFTITKK
jgi:outer membrane protein OmpA-like peptidoglycan-associated protein/tetratricopeptide (TPR) repeat protein